MEQRYVVCWETPDGEQDEINGLTLEDAVTTIAKKAADLSITGFNWLQLEPE